VDVGAVEKFIHLKWNLKLSSYLCVLPALSEVERVAIPPIRLTLDAEEISIYYLTIRVNEFAVLKKDV
jgi:hypothetical protein